MVYLREPVTGKEVDDGGDLNASGLHYGLAAMQGWRRNMEDAHLAVTELDDKISLFAVFDGHGGRGVSRFAAAKLPNLIKETEAYKQGDYVKALERAFLAVDEKLREAEGRKAIETLDRPDAGAAIHPMVVPRKVLQRFLGGGPGGQAQEDSSGDAAEGERSSDGEAAPQQDSKQPESEPEEDPAEEGAQEDKENKPAAEGEKDDEAETEEEPGTEDGGAEGSTEAEEGEEQQASGEAEENEDWEDDDMALVDPSRLTRDPTPEAQGCTAVVVLVVRREGGAGPQIFCANAGDSRAILSRGGRVVALSEDHKPENPGETARITKAGGYVQHMPGGARVQGDLNLSRAMGDLRYKKPENLPPEEQIVTVFPEVRTFSLTSEDEFMVLGCDGIWERSGNQEMVDFVRPRLATMNGEKSGTGLSKICGDICDKGLCPSMDTAENHSFDGTGCDNMTVMIVRMCKEIVERKRSADDEEPEPEVKKPKLDEQQESGQEEQT